MTIYLGFDPGRDKCGVAVMDNAGKILHHQVTLADNVVGTVRFLRKKYDVSLLIMGNQTTAQQWQQCLQAEISPPLAIALVNERNSSLEARTRYWEMFPPNFTQKLLPKGMRLPPRPIDDIVAILLIERYLESLKG
ncbi:Resolvase RNase H domain protein fold protein [[Leptolyngbya] sp. PCC 7376]|uniref:pre-16S rRNA-processing nuclease YqgF n=1 Tax=[Leptolyngbya] sp. PCC 7376 TaxID=111781 RepID=UPI00029EFC79|nr:pre-16S rRNA-processing nuclease YqgF [[Leptolyngbya] sp. PCC 7376]AFY37078.1 Resolvase RNase H domain protein fold protein [[Leptolyngbya] sp. PCC 7376]